MKFKMEAICKDFSLTSPRPSPLPPGAERGNVPTIICRNSVTVAIPAAGFQVWREQLPPLPEGEGWGEGKRDTNHSITLP